MSMLYARGTITRKQMRVVPSILPLFTAVAVAAFNSVGEVIV